MLDFIAVCLISGMGICLAFFTFLVVAESIKRAKIEVELTRGGEEDQSYHWGPGCLKIPADCPKTGDDFIVDLECPDGTVVRVRVTSPSDANSYEGRCSLAHNEFTPPVGFNYVGSGHYT